MDINPATATATAAGQSRSSTGLSDDFDSFLKLLTTQLQNQDPTQPLDADKFTAQLVQFSGVEQTIKTNSKLDRLVNLIEATQTTTALDYIGNEVEIAGNRLQLTEAGEVSLGYGLDRNVADVRINILNDDGKLVRQIEGPTAAGQHRMMWDGLDGDGVRQPNGTYRMMVSATDAEGERVEAETRITGRVDGLERKADELSLIVDGLPWPLESVRAARAADGR